MKESKKKTTTNKPVISSEKLEKILHLGLSNKIKKDSYKDRNIQMKYMVVQVEILMKGLEGQSVEISEEEQKD